MIKNNISVFWFRRDLRLFDNHGLNEALKGPFPVLPIFIFDDDIINELDTDDPRITFIYDRLNEISSELKNISCSLYCKKGTPEKVWEQLMEEFNIKVVYTNEDYEPYALERDLRIESLLKTRNISFRSFKDQVIFAKNDVLKNDGSPYTVFTPYKNKWLSTLQCDISVLQSYTIDKSNFVNFNLKFPKIEELGFNRSNLSVSNYHLDNLENYAETRNFPALDETSHLSPHLRFGTVSIRQVVKETMSNPIFLSELIWREFFMQILFHFPKVVYSNFKKKYDQIEWRNNRNEFELWTRGQTGFPMVDAGMRELNTTGYMHNRVRMVVAGFLCKHLLIDWRWGESYFASKLLDYELSSNNGNWQWAAGTGCDAAPYFRVFNPDQQVKKFDPDLKYIKKWVPEYNSHAYPRPMVDHKEARERAITTYRIGLSKN